MDVEKMEKTAKTIRSIGCLMTVFITIPIILFLLFFL